MQRNNIEVVVLEARERLGGRVHSYRGAFSCPVDLGASIITGTQVTACQPALCMRKNVLLTA